MAIMGRYRASGHAHRKDPIACPHRLRIETGTRMPRGSHLGQTPVPTGRHERRRDREWLRSAGGSQCPFPRRGVHDAADPKRRGSMARDRPPAAGRTVLEGAVGMQAGEEHVHAEKREGGDEQADQGPPRQHRATQPLDQPDVQPGRVVQPHDQRPGFLRIP